MHFGRTYYWSRVELFSSHILINLESAALYHVLCIHQQVLPGTCFGGGSAIDETELKDLNRVRSYLRDVATRHGVPFSDNVEDAIKAVIQSHAQNKRC